MTECDILYIYIYIYIYNMERKLEGQTESCIADPLPEVSEANQAVSGLYLQRCISFRKGLASSTRLLKVSP